MSRYVSGREMQIAGLISQGKTTKEIGNSLGISPNTVANLKKSLYLKTESRNIVDVAMWFIKL